jgi:hypothetical protein
MSIHKPDLVLERQPFAAADLATPQPLLHSWHDRGRLASMRASRAFALASFNWSGTSVAVPK